MSFSWTFVSQLRLKFVFCKRIWSKEVFLISTQWILSWLDNHHLIMNWWLSCKDIVLSVLIKSSDIFSLTAFLHHTVLSLQQLLTTLVRYRRELKNSYMIIYEYTIQIMIQWKTAIIFLININSFVFLLDNHQLIIDWFFSVKNMKLWALSIDKRSLQSFIYFVMVRVIAFLT